MSDTAKNNHADEALAAISQIMAGVGQADAPAAQAVAAPAPVLDLTRRVNADGTVTDLAAPGASGAARIQSAFANLRDMVAEQAPKAAASANPALEADVTPLVKAWLDEHLPAIVERVVREEVERLARRG